MAVSDRLTAWVLRTFAGGTARDVLAQLQDLPDGVVGGQDLERVQAALVVGTGGDWERFQRMLALAQRDWRDALVAAGLGNGDWPDRLDAILGPA